jgi:hypothetical protein
LHHFGFNFFPQPILSKPLEKGKSYNALRIKHGAKILLSHGANLYTIYAIRCNEIVNDTQKLDFIILRPGDPIELTDNNNNILILYSLPCN